MEILGALILGAIAGLILGIIGTKKVGKLDRRGHMDGVMNAVQEAMSTEAFRAQVLTALGFDEDDDEDEDEEQSIPRKKRKKGPATMTRREWLKREGYSVYGEE